MIYQILPYTKRQAQKLGVLIRPSFRKGKKIDVLNKKRQVIVSIGAKGYLDYPHYLKYFGKEIAEQKRKLYKKRHQKDRTKKGSAGWYADKLLW